MKDQINIEELFKEKLQNIEVSPKANAWANIQTGLTSPTAVTSATVSSSWVGTAIVAIVLTVATVGGFFYFNTQGEKIKNYNSIKKVENTTPLTLKIKQEEINKTETTLNEADIIVEKEEHITKVKGIKAETKNTIKKTATKTSTKNINVVTAKSDSKTDEVSNKTIDQIIAENQIVNQPGDSHAEESSNEKQLANSDPIPTKTTEKNNRNTNDATNSTDPKGNEINKKAQEILADKFLFPNVYTPDADGINDVFRMSPKNLDQIDNVEIKIFMLTKKLVGQWVGKQNGWNGNMLDGTPAPNGIYSYQATITIDTKLYPKTGTFRLIK